MTDMAKLIAATDSVAKRGLEDGRLTPRESSDVQETASLAEQWMPVIKQARIVIDTWNDDTDGDLEPLNKQLRKLDRMLKRVPVGRK